MNIRIRSRGRISISDHDDDQAFGLRHLHFPFLFQIPEMLVDIIDGNLFRYFFFKTRKFNCEYPYPITRTTRPLVWHDLNLPFLFQIPEMLVDIRDTMSSRYFFSKHGLGWPMYQISVCDFSHKPTTGSELKMITGADFIVPTYRQTYWSTDVNSRYVKTRYLFG